MSRCQCTFITLTLALWIYWLWTGLKSVDSDSVARLIITKCVFVQHKIKCPQTHWPRQENKHTCKCLANASTNKWSDSDRGQHRIPNDRTEGYKSLTPSINSICVSADLKLLLATDETGMCRWPGTLAPTHSDTWTWILPTELDMLMDRQPVKSM